MAMDNNERENAAVEDELAKAKARADKAEAELAKLKGKSGDAVDPTTDKVGSATSKIEATIGEIDAEDTRTIVLDGDGEGDSEGEQELRKDSTMSHLLDSLAEGKDIGHYGRLVFAIVARNFLSHEEVLGWLTRDSDFDEAKAEAMLRQVESRGYNPPKRERILEWQREQEFPILPDASDPDCGNMYRSLKFPDAVYQHIEEYQENKTHAEE